MSYWAERPLGELLGWPLNRRGEVVDCSITRRVTSLPLERFGKHLMVGIAGGRDKAPRHFSRAARRLVERVGHR